MHHGLRGMDAPVYMYEYGLKCVASDCQCLLFMIIDDLPSHKRLRLAMQVGR